MTLPYWLVLNWIDCTHYLPFFNVSLEHGSSVGDLAKLEVEFRRYITLRGRVNRAVHTGVAYTSVVVQGLQAQVDTG